MKKETYEKMKEQKLYVKAVNFIEILLTGGVPLDVIMTNDWACNYEPSVYVYGKRFKRLSRFNALRAIKYHDNK